MDVIVKCILNETLIPRYVFIFVNIQTKSPFEFDLYEFTQPLLTSDKETFHSINYNYLKLPTCEKQGVTSILFRRTLMVLQKKHTYRYFFLEF